MKTLQVSVFSEDHEFDADGHLEFPMFGSTYVLERLADSTLRFSKRAEGKTVDSAIVSVNLQGAAFTFDPRLLELPVVLKFSAGVVIHPRTSVRIFALMPVDVSLILKASGARVPVRNLAEGDILKTCYGPVDTGAVCYISYTDVYWSENEIPELTSFFAVLPMRIQNDAHDTINLKRILIEPWMFDLYENKDRLFATGVIVRIRSHSSAQLIYSEDPPHPEDRRVSATKTEPPRTWLERVLPRGRKRKLAYFEE
ncbi:MAG: DUF432 domain-containing protein [Candidatus Methylomirabilis sp.]|nr:DUF432 domain-containing protein [Deltaproteobacteria bacterium]